MKKIIIDSRTTVEEKDFLQSLGYEYLLCPCTSKVYPAICGHPDIQMHILDSQNIIVHKDISCDFVNSLKKLNINIMFSKNSLNSTYPLDITLNALNTPNFFMHNLKYTDPVLLKKVIGNKKLINVKQGYTKCSTAIVKDNAFMTSDTGIAKALYKENMDVLLLPPSHILLPHLDYGFIGGSCGLIEKNVLAFFGDLDNYPYGNDVYKFLKKHKVEPVFLKKGKLIDRGSLFIIGIRD